MAYCANSEDARPLYAQLGFDRHDGVIVAYIPKDDLLMGEHAYRDGSRDFTVYTRAGKVLDMLPLDGKAVKWWMVKEAARFLRLSPIEPIMSCAAEDFRVESLPQVPQPAGTVLAIRNYSRGPWLTFKTSKSKEIDDRV